MKRFAHILSAAAIITSPATSATAAGSSTIVVHVGSFRNADGVLGCALYAGRDTFLDPGTRSHSRARVAIAGKSATCSFSGIAPGSYAVAVLHDENRNGKMDTNLIGMPIEGYGVSNNKTRSLSAPTWEESKFDVEAGKSVAVSITLRY